MHLHQGQNGDMTGSCHLQLMEESSQAHKCVTLMGTCHHSYLHEEGDDSFITKSREYEEEPLRLCKGPKSVKHIREI